MLSPRNRAGSIIPLAAVGLAAIHRLFAGTLEVSGPDEAVFHSAVIVECVFRSVCL